MVRLSPFRAIRAAGRRPGAIASLFRVDLSGAVAVLTFEPLANRLARLPLVLAGPILRRTYPDSVTVWVALKEPRQVTLNVFAASDAARTIVLTGVRSTVVLGKSLHVVAVTATPRQANGLVQDVVYGYEFDFGAGQGLKSATNTADLAYQPYDFPSFALPPADIEDLHLIHGSCRKAHADSYDALPGASLIIENAIAGGVANEATAARRRPHALFLTGDQIYADDVADCLLDMLIDAGETLLGWGHTEILPGVQYAPDPSPGGTPDPLSPAAIAPGKRSDVIGKIAKLTSGIPDATIPKSHLMTLAEFYAMYLFVWSNVLWPDIFSTVGPPQERDAVIRFFGTLAPVRKALANVPTYMVCDDHDVTDDWFMNRQFCDQVLSSELGPRIIQNALTAYAVFQAWGNTPEQFAQGKLGADLLAALPVWTGGTTQDELQAYGTLGDRVGLPGPLNGAKELVRRSPALEWFYRVAIPGTKFEVIFFDCRTARRYPPKAPLHSPALLSPEAFAVQLDRYPAAPEIEVTLAVVQTPFFGLPWIEREQERFKGDDIWDNDCEAWGIQEHEFQRLAYQRMLSSLACRRKHVLILSGDVHYGFAARVNYWASKPFGTSQVLAPKQVSVLVQLNSSSLRNQNYPRVALVLHKGSMSLQRSGFSPWPNWPLYFETPDVQDWVGWAEGPVRFSQMANKDLTSEWYKPSWVNPPILDIAAKAPMTKLRAAEEWRYRIRFVKAAPYERIDTPDPLPALPANPRAALTGAAKVLRHHRQVKTTGYGLEIVGANNIGQLRFTWSTDLAQRSVSQTLWWRREGDGAQAPALQPLSVFSVSLNPADPAEPPPISG